MIRLSNLQRKNADRLAGIEYMLPWPADLPPPADLRPGEGRDAMPREIAAAHALLADELERLDLRIIDVAAVYERMGGAASRIWSYRLAVHIIGPRWVEARRRLPNPPVPLVAWPSGMQS